MNISWGFYIEHGVLTKYMGTGEDVYVPDRVTAVAKGAFFRKTKMTSVRLPKNAEVDSRELFFDCRSLRETELPETMTTFGNHMFFNCENLNEIHIPESVTSIGMAAFYNCRKLTELRLPLGVTSIGAAAFHGCAGLKECSIPSGVTKIERQTFQGCTRLEKIVFPDTIVSIAEDAFEGCDRLPYNRYGGCVYLGSTANPYYALLWGESKDITAAAIHKDTKLVAKWAFHDCRELRSVTIEGDPLIPSSTFFGCDKLQTIIAPNADPNKLKKASLSFYGAVGYLGNQERYTVAQVAEAWKKYAFSQRKRLLKEVLALDIPLGLAVYAEKGKITAANIEEEYLEPAMAANATQCVAYLLDWKEKHIPPEELEKQAERELRKDPYNAADMKKQWDCLKRADGTWLLLGYKGNAADVTVPPRIGRTPVTILGPGTFSERKVKDRVLRSVTIPEGITGIWYGAFTFCEDLVRIRIPATVREIDKHAFDYCGKLTIQAPAGSYAETYAKEKEIPFVEE